MNQCKSTIEWGDFNSIKRRHSYLNQLFEFFNLAENNRISVASALSELCLVEHFEHADIPQFVDNSAFSHEQRYYEQIIAELNQVPSRETSWHDFFNGLIWLQFPTTKKLLNRLHIEQIQAFGLHPRTHARNQITHFDECGLVLVGTEPAARVIADALATHNWQLALFEEKQSWHTILHPIVFGHANLEMLINPFMSLTAKWVYIECPQLDINKGPSHNNLASIDLALCEHIVNQQLFVQKRRLKPLPLMGVPGWCDNQNPAFYQQTKFFRPLNAKANKS